MAQSDKDRKALIKQYKVELVTPLERTWENVGVLNAVFRQHAETELMKAAAIVGAIDGAIEAAAWQSMEAADSRLQPIYDRLQTHLGGTLGRIAETADSRWPSLEPSEQPDGSGFISGTDTRSPNEKAADPLSSGGCPTVRPNYQTIVPNAPFDWGSLIPPTTQPTPQAPTQQMDGATRPSIPSQPALAQDCSVDKYKDVQRFVANLPDNAGEIFSQWFAFNFGGVISTLIDNPIVGGTVNAVFGTIANVVNQIMGKQFEQIERMTAASGCESTTINSLTALQGIMRSLQQYIPMIPQRLLTPIDYATHSLCPVDYPDWSESINAYLTGSIGESTLQTWLAQNNKCWEPFSKVVEARRSKPAPFELAQMRLRGIITPSEYDNMMRQIGFTFKRNSDDLFKLAEQIPPMSEILRYMVRDADDDKGPQSTVQRFGMDDLFDAKFGDQLRKWSEQQGISEQFARYSWRAHWSIPAPGQLFTMLHRLRNRSVGDPARITDDDIRAALVQQDILPFWIDKYIAISYRPLTRIDVRRAYDIGAIDRARVKLSYTDLGYNDVNAEALTVFTEKLRNNGIWNARPLKQWKAELIDADEARRQLVAMNYPELLITDAINTTAKTQRGNSYVKRFAKGFITRGEAEAGLNDHGLAPVIYRGWLDDAAQSYRMSPAVKLFGADRISRQDAELRLTNSGIDPAMFGPWLDDAAAAKDNHWAVAHYRKGIISRDAADIEMRNDGLAAATIAKLLDRATAEVKAETRSKCAAFAVDRFIHGEMNADGLLLQLVGMGIPANMAQEMVNRAECELSAKGKDPSTATLCGWLELGMIEPVDFVQRLERVGWSNDDAVRILRSCLSKINVNRAREAEKQAKGEAADTEKQRREIEKFNKQIERERIAIIRRGEAAKKTQQRRENQILKAADTLRDALGIELSDAVRLVRAEKQRVQIEQALTVDDAIAAVVLAVESGQFESPDDFTAAVNDAGVSLLASRQIASESNGNGVEIT